uniref:C3H1-type domain-containing protein n=1 Tax=Strombidinopsis acuminata TaxID=141414 RepID=A0A7S3WQA4_9SPIT
MSPMAEAAGQAREGIRRKKPLLLGPLLFGSEAAAEPAPSPSAYAIPVHRTFIEFGCLEQTPTSGHWRMLTAPASMAHSMRADLEAEAAAAEVVYAPGRNSAGADGNTVVAGPPGSAASSTRQGSSNHSAAARDLALPAVTYRLSPTSARASGYATWGGLPRAKEGSGEQPDCDSGSTDDPGDFSEEDEDLGICPEYSEGAALPSLGSAGHGEGTCRRCCFFPKGRCNNGDDCTFCHFAHEKRKPKNKKKNKHNKRRARNRNKLMASGVMDMEPFLGVSQVPMGAALIECMGPNIHIVMDESMEGQAVALVPVSFCTYCT